MRDAEGVVLSGSSAAGGLDLELVAPDTIDAYVPAERLQELVVEHALQNTEPAQANVMLRAVPEGAWMLDGRELAPTAAVALDLTFYADPRSTRAGRRVLSELDHGPRKR